MILFLALLGIHCCVGFTLVAVRIFHARILEWVAISFHRGSSLTQVKSVPLAFAVWLRKLKQGLCINLEGWGGEEGGRGAQKGGDICIPMADSC